MAFARYLNEGYIEDAQANLASVIQREEQLALAPREEPLTVVVKPNPIPENPGSDPPSIDRLLQQAEILQERIRALTGKPPVEEKLATSTPPENSVANSTTKPVAVETLAAAGRTSSPRDLSDRIKPSAPSEFASMLSQQEIKSTGEEKLAASDPAENPVVDSLAKPSVVKTPAFARQPSRFQERSASRPSEFASMLSQRKIETPEPQTSSVVTFARNDGDRSRPSFFSQSFSELGARPNAPSFAGFEIENPRKPLAQESGFAQLVQNPRVGSRVPRPSVPPLETSPSRERVAFGSGESAFRNHPSSPSHLRPPRIAHGEALKRPSPIAQPLGQFSTTLKPPVVHQYFTTAIPNFRIQFPGESSEPQTSPQESNRFSFSRKHPPLGGAFAWANTEKNVAAPSSEGAQAKSGASPWPSFYTQPLSPRSSRINSPL
jgi:hypothetical protein